MDPRIVVTMSNSSCDSFSLLPSYRQQPDAAWWLQGKNATAHNLGRVDHEESNRNSAVRGSYPSLLVCAG